MITDLWTMMWKELKELTRLQGRGGKVHMLIIISIIGVILPFYLGRSWVKSPFTILLLVWISLVPVCLIIADSFAGERERHTLETLLCSCISDSAILFGKICTAVAYGWSITLICAFIGLITINFFHGERKLVFYSLPIGIGMVMLSLLADMLIGCVGALISLRSSSVRQAQQNLIIIIFLLYLMPAFGALMLPVSWKHQLINVVVATNTIRIIFVVAAVLIILDIILMTIVARFKRTQMILNQ